MFRKRNRLYLFITDEMIYYVLRNKSNKILVCDEEALSDGIILNGDIKEPLELCEVLKNIISKNKMKVGEISFLINEENILIRKLSVNKEEMTEKTIKDHIKKQIGDTIHFPFERPVYDVHIQKETEASYEAVILITNEDMLQDYLDVFEKLWITNVDFETSLISLYRLYNHNHSEVKKDVSKKVNLAKDSISNDGVMLVALYNNNASLIIFDGIYPVFSLIEEIESKENYCEFVANYIERISNYYSFNMHKGKKEIESILIFNFTSGDINEIIKEKMQVCVERKSISFYNFSETPLEYSKNIPNGCYIPAATGMER
jgi:type IV pilus assembly protein PilM